MTLATSALCLHASAAAQATSHSQAQVIHLRGDAGGKRFDGIGVVDGGGATSVLLKDYPEPQRSQILDMVYKPKFGASVSALLVEIPGDANSTQSTMPSHMHTRDDLNYHRGYTWWVLREAARRNPKLTLDGTAWSAPGWVGGGKFFTQDAADYYVKWLQGLRTVYGLEFDAIGCRNEKGVSYDFAERLRATLNVAGFGKVKVHCFDNFQPNKLDFAKDMFTDEKLRNSIDILSAHTLRSLAPAKAAEMENMAARLNKPIWDTEEHVYKSGFDDEISIVQAFNENFITIGATKIVNWYGIAGIYPMEPYSETPSMLLARSPWNGRYDVREALWGYAHYGQFTEAGWQYLNGGSGRLAKGGTFVTLDSPGKDYSIILETKDAKEPQQIRFEASAGLSSKALCVWRSNAAEQFVRQPDIQPVDGTFSILLDPNSIYSLSTTTGQQKGSFQAVPAATPFPFPYNENFEEYTSPAEWGYLPRYTVDVGGVFEIADRADGKGKALRQVVPVSPISWAPAWLPYTILGDSAWQNYGVSADIFLSAGESAGMMGRVNDVGTGFGYVPKGYFFQLSSDGKGRLVVVRGNKPKGTPVGDVEQQALLKNRTSTDDFGEKVLGETQVSGVQPNQWHRVELRFEGSAISAWVDGQAVLRVEDSLYSHGMAGLLAGVQGTQFSTPYFDNLEISDPDAPRLPPVVALPTSPIYGAATLPR